MEATRPHYDWPIEQLVEHADQHTHHRAVLERVLAELDHRPGSRAKLIARRIERRLAMLDVPNRTGTHDLRTALAAAADEIEMLRRHLVEADLRIEELERSTASASAPHARLHLTADAPLWLVTEVRRAIAAATTRTGTPTPMPDVRPRPPSSAPRNSSRASPQRRRGRQHPFTRNRLDGCPAREILASRAADARPTEPSRDLSRSGAALAPASPLLPARSSPHRHR